MQKAIKRRVTWPDCQTAFDHYRAKPVFERWPDEALSSYVDEGFVETADGDLTLALSRDWLTKSSSYNPWTKQASGTGTIAFLPGRYAAIWNEQIPTSSWNCAAALPPGTRKEAPAKVYRRAFSRRS